MLFFATFKGIEWNIVCTPSGTIYSVAFVIYVYLLLSNYEASLVSPLYNFNVFFLFILSVLFLNEAFYWFKLAGVLFLFIGTSLLDKKQSLKESIIAVFTNRGCLLMILVSLLLSWQLGRVIDGFFVKSTTDPFLYAIIQYFVVSLYLFIAIIILKRFRVIKTAIKSHYKHFLLGSFANAYSYILLLVSISIFGLRISIAEPLSHAIFVSHNGIVRMDTKRKNQGSYFRSNLNACRWSSPRIEILKSIGSIETENY